MCVRLCIRKLIWEKFCDSNAVYRAPSISIQKPDFDHTFQSLLSILQAQDFNKLVTRFETELTLITKIFPLKLIDPVHKTFCKKFSKIKEIYYTTVSEPEQYRTDIWNQWNVMSIAGYVDPTIVDGWEFDNFEEEN